MPRQTGVGVLPGTVYWYLESFPRTAYTQNNFSKTILLLLIDCSFTQVYGPSLQIFMHRGSLHSGVEQYLVHTPLKADT